MNYNFGRMIRPCLLVAVCIAFTSSAVEAATLKPTEKGVAIDAGSLGEFTLEYPSLLDASQKPLHKLVEAHATGASAALKYEGGGQIDLTISAVGEGVREGAAGKLYLAYLRDPDGNKICALHRMPKG